MKMLANVKLSPHKYKSPEGYLICQDCIIARTGAQTYLRSEIYDDDDNGNEFIDINRSEEEVFDPKTIASFENKPLTIEHPDNSVNPSNYKSLAVGNVHNVHKGEYEGEPVMYADIVVFDAQAIDLIESGEMVELSCGYDCDITDGPNPEQINIRGNHVALCEQGRAGIARIQDSKSWGAKPVKDSVGRGTLIQEFGKQGKQYKIQKIVGNVIYAESLENGKTILFKKDEENIEWATITKSEVKDSISEKRYIVMSFAYSRGRWFEVGEGNTIEEAEKEYENYLQSCKQTNENTSFPQEYIVQLKENRENGMIIESATVTKKGKIIKDSINWEDKIKSYMKSKAQYDYNNEELPETAEQWANRLIGNDMVNEFNRQLTKEEKELVKEYANYIYDKFLAGYKMALSVKDDIPEYIEQYDLILTTDKCWDMTLNKVDDWIFEKYGCNRLSVEEIGKRIDEGKLCLIPIVREYGNVGESQVKVLEIGPFHSMEEVNQFANGELKSFIDSHKEDKKEHIIITIKKDVINLKDLTPAKEVKDEEPKESNPEYLEAYNEMFDHFNSIEGVSTDLKDYETKNKLLIFDVFGKLDWNKEKEYIREIMKKHNQKILWTDEEEGWYVITTPVEHAYIIWYTNRTPVHDAESHHYIIALEDINNESAWLDDMDRPTNDINKAKKFATYEEADSHRKTYCKGAVQQIKDSKKPIDYKALCQQLRQKFHTTFKAQPEYDCIEAPYVYGNKELDKQITDYLKSLGFEIEFDGIDDAGCYNFKDSKIDMEGIAEDINLKKEVEAALGNIKHGPIKESWGSVTVDFDNREDLRKAAKKLIKLFDIELFEDDEDDPMYIAVYEKLKKPLKDSLVILSKIKDAYSKRFYTNAIKQLEAKLEKLEKNELLDSNQQDYEKQKNAMKETIKSQIEEYKKKLGEYEAGDHE